MFRDLDDKIRQTNGQTVRLTQQLIGVVGEEEYFARQEEARARKLAEERRATYLAAERERERVLHLMKCPKCGMRLEEIAFGEVRIDKCFSCDGLWLDKGELDLIRAKDGGVMARMLSMFG
jgi:uncharacterized protein